MNAILIVALIIGGCFLFSFFLKRVELEWACAALIFPMVILGGVIAIFLTIQGMPPLIIAVIGMGTVILPTWLFFKLLEKIEALVSSLATSKETDNKEELCKDARDLGDNLMKKNRVPKPKLVAKPKPVAKPKMVEKPIATAPEVEAVKESYEEKAFQKAKLLFEMEQYRLSYELLKYSMQNTKDFHKLQEIVVYKRLCVEKMNEQEQKGNPKEVANRKNS